MFGSQKQDFNVASVMASNPNCRVAILTADDFQDMEFFYPYYRLVEEGCQVDVITPKGGEVKGKGGQGLLSTHKIEECAASDYQLLYIPGGKAPEKLCKELGAVEFVKSYDRTERPLAAICHGALLLVEAGLAKGKRLAAWPEVQKDIEEAGGTFVNAPVCVDGKIITARWPGDLPAHLAGVLKACGLRSEQKLPKAA